MAKQPPPSRRNSYLETVAATQVRMPDALHERIRVEVERAKAAKEAGNPDGPTSINAWLLEAAEQKLAGTLRSTDPAKRIERLEQDVRDLKKRLAKVER